MGGVILLFVVAFLIVYKVKAKADSVRWNMEEKDRRQKEAIRKAREKKIREIDKEIERLDRELEESEEDDYY